MALHLPSGTFCGEVRNSFECESARFSENVYLPGHSQPTHSHELPHICLTAKGTYLEVVERKKRTIPRGAVTFYHPDQAHSDSHVMCGTHFVIEIYPRNSAIRSLLPSFQSDPIFRGPTVSLAWRIFAEFQKRDRFSALTMEALTLELIVESFRPPSARNEKHRPLWMNRVQQILHDSFPAAPQLSEIASEVGVHPVHLARTFRRCEHVTIGQYVRKLRIDCVRDRLATTDDCLVKIALDAGFADQMHLNRTFKQATGFTPREFRMLVRGSATSTASSPYKGLSRFVSHSTKKI